MGFVVGLELRVVTVSPCRKGCWIISGPYGSNVGVYTLGGETWPKGG